MNEIGYRYFTDKGLVGDAGLYYDYVVGANGLFIKAENRFISATVCVGEARVRGLQPVRPLVVLKQGKIPWSIYHAAISHMMLEALHEQYLAVSWNNGYQLIYPQQVGDTGSCLYERVPDTVMELHSHGLMQSFFSGVDNRDELGLQIYAVVGNLDTLIPEVKVRIGVYGYYDKLSLNEVFGNV